MKALFKALFLVCAIVLFISLVPFIFKLICGIAGVIGVILGIVICAFLFFMLLSAF